MKLSIQNFINYFLIEADLRCIRVMSIRGHWMHRSAAVEKYFFLALIHYHFLFQISAFKSRLGGSEAQRETRENFILFSNRTNQLQRPSYFFSISVQTEMTSLKYLHKAEMFSLQNQGGFFRMLNVAHVL